MHSRVIVVSVTIALLSAALAGCLGGLGPQSNNSTAPPLANETTGGDGAGDDGNGTADDGSEGNSTDGSDDGSDGSSGDEADDGTGNETGDDGSGNGTYAPGWPSASQAPIRPGVKVHIETDDGTIQCTAAFVFSSPDNRTLYLSLASHCVSGKSIGDTVDVPGVGTVGEVVYCSWGTIEDKDTCPDGDGPNGGLISHANDLALVEIRSGRRGQVHPAMLGFGGPTGMADSGSVGTGDKVMTYGNSGLRDGYGTAPGPAGSALDPREGVVYRSDGMTTVVYFAPPSISGDSGSPVITGDGQALGVLSSGHTVPPQANGIVNLDAAVAYMEDNTDLDVELKTWGLLDAGLLP